MYVKPLNGRKVPDPAHGDLLPVEGRTWPNDQYCQRRIMDGDVEETADPNAEPAKAEAKPVSESKTK